MLLVVPVVLTVLEPSISVCLFLKRLIGDALLIIALMPASVLVVPVSIAYNGVLLFLRFRRVPACSVLFAFVDEAGVVIACDPGHVAVDVEGLLPGWSFAVSLWRS